MSVAGAASDGTDAPACIISTGPEAIPRLRGVFFAEVVRLSALGFCMVGLGLLQARAVTSKVLLIKEYTLNYNLNLYYNAILGIIVPQLTTVGSLGYTVRSRPATQSAASKNLGIRARGLSMMP